MNDTTDSRSQRIPFLLRQVKAPHWLQVILLAAWIYVVVGLAIHNPLLAIGLLVISIVFCRFVVFPLRRRTGQWDEHDEANAIKAAPSKKAALRVAWEQARTYQVWWLGLLTIATAMMLLERAGVITTF